MKEEFEATKRVNIMANRKSTKGQKTIYKPYT
jgi:hypothetical protein